MAEHFSAFSFVDRITELEAGTRAKGQFAVPDGLPYFPACLVAEAVGQLAAWVAMHHAGFRRRPVAGLAGETRFLGEVTPGQCLDLEVEIESCDDEAVAYGGGGRGAGGKGGVQFCFLLAGGRAVGTSPRGGGGRRCRRGDPHRTVERQADRHRTP